MSGLKILGIETRAVREGLSDGFRMTQRIEYGFGSHRDPGSNPRSIAYELCYLGKPAKSQPCV